MKKEEIKKLLNQDECFTLGVSPTNSTLPQKRNKISNVKIHNKNKLSKRSRENFEKSFYGYNYIESIS